jgi:hypothetical protein
MRDIIPAILDQDHIGFEIMKLTLPGDIFCPSVDKVAAADMVQLL